MLQWFEAFPNTAWGPQLVDGEAATVHDVDVGKVQSILTGGHATLLQWFCNLAAAAVGRAHRAYRAHRPPPAARRLSPPVPAGALTPPVPQHGSANGSMALRARPRLLRPRPRTTVRRHSPSSGEKAFGSFAVERFVCA